MIWDGQSVSLGVGTRREPNRKFGSEPPKLTVFNLMMMCGSVPEERREAGDAYFESMSRMQSAITKQQYEKAAGLARENLGTIPKWIEEESYNAAMAPVRQGAMDRYLGMDSQVEPELADEERSLLPPSIPVFQQGGHDTGAGRRRGGPVSHGGPCEEHT